jgi:hypothetical protein
MSDFLKVTFHPDFKGAAPIPSRDVFLSKSSILYFDSQGNNQYNVILKPEYHIWAEKFFGSGAKLKSITTRISEQDILK